MVVETRYIPLGLEPLHCQDFLHDGDHSVGSSVSSSGRLDGLHRSEGGVLAGSHTFRQSQVPAVCGLRQALSVSGSLLRPLHGSPGLHQGYGSDLVYSPQSRTHLRRYLDDWLIPAHSREAVLRSLDTALSLCRELGIVVNPAKSNFVPTQRVQYLGTVLDA